MSTRVRRRDLRDPEVTPYGPAGLRISVRRVRAIAGTLAFSVLLLGARVRTLLLSEIGDLLVVKVVVLRTKYKITLVRRPDGSCLGRLPAPVPGTVSGADLLESTGIRLRFHTGNTTSDELERLSPGASQWGERHSVLLFSIVSVTTVVGIYLLAVLTTMA
ncbi:hypothetical protein [Cellulomonas sp. URHE0023]|uniref:hypothetical protein n=1 Tax=Cellulomonas sp. URHE0023 TaxID=1380354 RepID=UPI0004809574|nr:hypothetical protein [Cellulomonas sp. URHE0023]